MRSYNDIHHRSIGMAPSKVNTSNQEEVWQRVRISKAKRQFKKDYMANWSEEVFSIHDVHPSDPPVYWLNDDPGEVLHGTFYEPEQQRVSVPIDKLYRVESVLLRRKVGKRSEALVKWYGYPSKFNSWIDAKLYYVDESVE